MYFDEYDLRKYTSLEYNLKNAFDSYYKVKSDYEKAKADIKALEYEMQNVKAVKYNEVKETKKGTSHSMNKFYKYSDRLEELEQQKKMLSNILKGFDMILNSINDDKLKQEIIDEYIKKYDRLNKKFN